jgi:hypothetical protein
MTSGISYTIVGDQIISIARTKNVVTKGMIRVSHGQCVIIARASKAVERKNNIQYIPLDLRFTSMKKDFCKNRGSGGIMDGGVSDGLFVIS